MVDTGAFAAGAIRRDLNHGAAVAVFNDLQTSRRPLLTTNLILAETHALLLARAGRDIALEVLHRIDNSVEVLRVSAVDEQDGRRILDRYTDKAFSLTDAITFAVMDRLGIREAFTFDHHFRQYGLTMLEPS